MAPGSAVYASGGAFLRLSMGKFSGPGLNSGLSNRKVDRPRCEQSSLWRTCVEPAGETGRHVLEQIWSRPTCDVNGIWGGYTGEGAKTVIAAEARAKVSFRLVGKQNPAAIKKAFRAFVSKQIPADCSVEFIDMKGSPAVSLPFDSAPMTAARRSV